MEITGFFSVTQILREINFEDSRSSKSATLTHLGALNFGFQEFLYFLKAEVYRINKMAKDSSFRTSKFCKIEFT